MCSSIASVVSRPCDPSHTRNTRARNTFANTTTVAAAGTPRAMRAAFESLARLLGDSTRLRAGCACCDRKRYLCCVPVTAVIPAEILPKKCAYMLLLLLLRASVCRCISGCSVSSLASSRAEPASARASLTACLPDCLPRKSAPRVFTKPVRVHDDGRLVCERCCRCCSCVRAHSHTQHVAVYMLLRLHSCGRTLSIYTAHARAYSHTRRRRTAAAPCT